MTEVDITTFELEAAKVIEFLHTEFSKLQTGRANASLVEHVEVDAYDQKQPLKAVAGISIEDAKTIVVQPWDKSVMQSVDRALQEADLGCSPVNDGVVIRLCLPPMTEDRRKHLVKVVHQLAEEAKISIRHHRQKAQENIKLEKDEDLRDTELENLQKAVEKANADIDESKKKKEEEVMTV